MGISVIFVALLLVVKAVLSWCLPPEVKPAQECVLSVPFPWNRPGWLCLPGVWALSAWDFSLHCLPLVLQGSPSEGVFLVSLRVYFSFLQSQPSGFRLKVSYCYLQLSCPLLPPFRVSDSSASFGLPM